MVRVMFLQEVWYPLGAVMLLSAMLKKAGHSTAVSVGEEEKLLYEVDAFSPDIIAIPTITPYRRFMVGITKALREHGYRGVIIAGGYDMSFSPEIIEVSPLDTVCVGEGDEALVEVADCLDRRENWSRTRNLWVKKDGRLVRNPLRPFMDVNKKPFIDRDIYRDYDSYFSDIEFEQITVGRGCPYTCSYCYNLAFRALYAGVDRDYCDLRDPQKVIEEILMIEKRYPHVNTIYFNDGTLGYDKGWLREFCKLYKERGIGLDFIFNICVNEIDRETCQTLASVKKCHLLKIGLESGDERMRVKVLNKSLCTDEVWQRATRLLQEHNLRYSLQIMLGLPGETLEGACRTLEMAVQMSTKNTVVGVNIFKPFPKLGILAYGVRTGDYDSHVIHNERLPGPDSADWSSAITPTRETKRIHNLAYLSHAYMEFPFTRGIIKRWLVNLPDNRLFRAIMHYTEYYYTICHDVNVSWRYLIKYTLMHSRKADSIMGMIEQ